MNKAEWIKVVTAKTGLTQKDVEAVLETGLEEIYQSVKWREKVTLVNFGTFYIDERRTGTVFKFNPSQKWPAMLGWSSSYKGEL